MAEAFDLNKFIRVVAMTGSAADGECLNAIRLANDMLKRTGATWSDVLNGEDHVAVEACKSLLADLAAAQARIAELERQLPDWQPVTKVTIGNHNRAARWLLDLHAAGQVRLAAREQALVDSVAGWIGPLRQKQREWFQDILNRTAARTGLVPP
jgi:hypothetical protein